MGIFDVLRHNWDVFRNREPTYYNSGYASSYRPDRTRLTGGNEKSIITSIFNRIAIDASLIDIKHCKVDAEDRYVETINSGLNNCLTLEANIDQTGRAFIHDAVLSMLDEGVVALVPTHTSIDPTVSGSYNIDELRTGKIIEWRPKEVMVRLYNEDTGQEQDVLLPKKIVGIVENPLYAVVNEPNGTTQRLKQKMALLDSIDATTNSGKLDMVIQLPYIIKSEAKRKEAEKRMQSIEDQLKGPYGIAYIDGTEKVIQLNRPVENNLAKQVDDLTKLLFSQIGLTEEILNGTADEQAMLNYHSRTIEPILLAIVDEMKRKFLTKTARTQMQTIKFFRDPFRLVPLNSMAEIADKFTRNEITSSNEIRQAIGMKPSKDPKADQLINSNLNHPEETTRIPVNNNETQDTSSETKQQTNSNTPMNIGDIPISMLPDIDV